MTSEQRENIKTMDIEMITTQNEIADYTYQVDFMKEVHEKFKVFDELSTALVNKNFKLLDQKRNVKDFPTEIEGVMNQKFQFLEKEYGKLSGYKTFGLAEQGDASGRAYQFQAYLNFEKRDVPYFFYLDTREGKDEWIGFSIKN